MWLEVDCDELARIVLGLSMLATDADRVLHRRLKSALHVESILPTPDVDRVCIIEHFDGVDTMVEHYHQPRELAGQIRQFLRARADQRQGAA